MPISPEHKEILKSKSESKTLPEWVNYFDNQYTYKQIQSFCYHNGYKARKRTKEEISKTQSQNARKYNINQDFFKTWTHDMAYILGFWFADGCIYRGQMFDITVHKKDKYILKKMAEKIGYEGNIYDYVDKQACRLNFSCVVIYNDIIKLGGQECKSLTIKFPISVPKEYLHDFIRGYFDGDGSIMNVQGGRINISFCSGSDEFLKELLQVIKDNTDIEGGSLDLKYHRLVFGKRDSILLCEYMYKDNPELFLLRKKKRFDDFMDR